MSTNPGSAPCSRGAQPFEDRKVAYLLYPFFHWSGSGGLEDLRSYCWVLPALGKILTKVGCPFQGDSLQGHPSVLES